MKTTTQTRETPLTATMPQLLPTLEEYGQLLRVHLDKAENMKVTAGKYLKEALDNHFNGDRAALKEWYEGNVVRWEGTYYEHREWSTVEKSLGTVIKHGDKAAEAFARQNKGNAERVRRHREKEAALRNAPKKDKDFDPRVPSSGWTDEALDAYHGQPEATEEDSARLAFFKLAEMAQRIKNVDLSKVPFTTEMSKAAYEVIQAWNMFIGGDEKTIYRMLDGSIFTQALYGVAHWYSHLPENERKELRAEMRRC